MNNKPNPNDGSQYARLSVPALSAEDSRRPDGPFFRYDFPVSEANPDISKEFRPGQNVCSEIFL